MQIPATGHYCLNGSCGADDDHLEVDLADDGKVTIACYRCGYVGTEEAA